VPLANDEPFRTESPLAAAVEDHVELTLGEENGKLVLEPGVSELPLALKGVERNEAPELVKFGKEDIEVVFALELEKEAPELVE